MHLILLISQNRLINHFIKLKNKFLIFMPKKGKAKNTLNKAKHTKLMNRKINKVKLEKQQNKERLKVIIKKANEQKNTAS